MKQEGLWYRISTFSEEYVFSNFINFVNKAPIEIIKRDWKQFNEFQSQFNPFNRLQCNLLGDFIQCMN